VHADEVRGFLEPLPVGRVWGVGWVAEQRLRAVASRTTGELARNDEARLRTLLGEALGAQAASLARGLDARTVVAVRDAVSYSEENTFDRDVSDRARIGAVIQDHAESVARRLRRDALAARTVVLKVKLGTRRPDVRGGGARAYPILPPRATRAAP